MQGASKAITCTCSHWAVGNQGSHFIIIFSFLVCVGKSLHAWQCQRTCSSFEFCTLNRLPGLLETLNHSHQVSFSLVSSWDRFDFTWCGYRPVYYFGRTFVFMPQMSLICGNPARQLFVKGSGGSYRYASGTSVRRHAGFVFLHYLLANTVDVECKSTSRINFQSNTIMS